MPSIGTEETEHMAYNIEETQDIPYAAWLDLEEAGVTSL